MQSVHRRILSPNWGVGVMISGTTYRVIVFREGQQVLILCFVLALVSHTNAHAFHVMMSVFGTGQSTKSIASNR